MSCKATDVQTEMDVEGLRIVEFTTQETTVPLTEMLLNPQNFLLILPHQYQTSSGCSLLGKYLH